MPGSRRRIYPETDLRPSKNVGFGSPNNPVIGPEQSRTILSAERVMRFCCPDRPRPNPQSLHTTGAEKQMPVTMSDSNTLPLFGDLISYGATISRQRDLWDLEIRRLLLQTEGTPADTLAPKLRPSEHSLLQSPIRDDELYKLRSAADRVLHGLNICVLDDQNLINEEFPENARARETGTRSYRELQKVARLDTSQNPRLPGQDEKSHAPRTKYLVNGRAFEESELEDYHYIVDQITATMARSAILGSDSQYWHVVVLACLAKLSTKLKFLAVKLDKYISQSLARNVRFNYAEDFDSSDIDDWTDFGLLTDSSPMVERYCTEFDVVTTWLVDSMSQVLKDLGARKPWGVRNNHLDLCAVVYRTGIIGTRTLLYQGREGSVSGSCATIPLAYTSIALKLIHELGASWFLTSGNGGNDNTTTAATTTTLTYESVELADGKMRILQKTWSPTNIIDVILVSIPLSLSCPMIGYGFETSLRTISALSAYGNTNLPVTNTIISAFVSLRSSHNTEIEGRGVFSSLSNSAIATMRHNVFQRQIWISSSSGEHLRPNSIKDAVDDAEKKRRDLKKITDKWAIQETSIVIGCATYVNAILSFCASLVIGGLLCGFLVGERIPGVDPFNLTMFSWIIGGFVFLIAKSVMVSDWTWRDFLLRQVTCRSLSEVSSVSGLDAQDILVFLLSSEFETRLNTGGSYQQSFYYNPVVGGFSIDVKPTLHTLLASGSIPLMLSTLSGPVLIMNHHASAISGYSHTLTKGTGRKWKVYSEFPTSEVEGDAISTGYKDISWINLLGLYNSMGTSFR